MYESNARSKDFNKVKDFKGNLNNAPITEKLENKKYKPYQGNLWQSKLRDKNNKINVKPKEPYKGSVGQDVKPAKNYELPKDYYGKRRKFKGAAFAIMAANKTKPVKTTQPPPRQKTPPPRQVTPPPVIRQPSPKNWRPDPEPARMVAPLAARPVYRRASPPPPDRNIYYRSRPAPLFPPLIPVYEPDMIILTQTQADVVAQRTRFPMIPVSSSPRVELVSDRRVYEYPSATVEKFIDRLNYDELDYARVSYRQDEVPPYGSVGSILRSSRVYGY